MPDGVKVLIIVVVAITAAVLVIGWLIPTISMNNCLIKTDGDVEFCEGHYKESSTHVIGETLAMSGLNWSIASLVISILLGSGVLALLGGVGKKIQK